MVYKKFNQFEVIGYSDFDFVKLFLWRLLCILLEKYIYHGGGTCLLLRGYLSSYVGEGFNFRFKVCENISRSLVIYYDNASVHFSPNINSSFRSKHCQAQSILTSYIDLAKK